MTPTSTPTTPEHPAVVHLIEGRWPQVQAPWQVTYNGHHWALFQTLADAAAIADLLNDEGVEPYGEDAADWASFEEEA